MNCPYCNKKMERGYLQCRDGLFWTPKRAPIAALSFLLRGSTSLANGACESSKTVHAYNCRSCKKVLIDYASNEQTESEVL